MATRKLPYGKDPLTQRIIKLKGDVSDISWAEGLGISNVSRKFAGIRPWSRKDLLRISKHYRIPWPKIMEEPARAPLIIAPMSKEGLNLKEIEETKEFLEYYPPEGLAMNEAFYAWQVSGDDLLPAYRTGSILIIQENSYKLIRDTGLILFRDTKNRGHLRRIQRCNGVLILTHPIKVNVMETLPESYIRQCDLVKWVQYP